jgi:sortase A
MKPLRYFVIAILVAGFGLSSRAVYLHAKAELASILIHRAWQETATTGKSLPPWPWADYHPVARLRIPRLGYDEIILDPATPRTLAFGPAHLLSGAAFGESGNLEIAGHRDSWFLPLKSITLGDTIELQWFDARTHQLRQKTYTVQSVDVVDPANMSLLAPTTTDTLTLITCYPFGSSPHSPQRFVVRANPQSRSTT